ncbi:MAG: hypothetical protein MMC23_000760 [Stictis urceolatum]|nr:hypothetical protein [Stictis urceolata]
MTTLLAASVVSAAAASPSALPTLILVPSAWQSPTIFTPLLAHLGPYPVLYAQALPSVAPANPASINAASDAEYLRLQLIQPLLDAGKTCVLVAHNYGVIPCMTAAVDLSPAHRRREGKAGGVLGVITLAGWIVPEGETARNVLVGGGGQVPEWFHPDAQGLSPLPPFEVFSAEAPVGQHDFLRSTLSDSAVVLLDVPVPAQAWSQKEFKGKCAYVRLPQVAIFPEDVQDRMRERSESLGGEWVVRTAPTTRHYPWLKEPGKVADLVKELVMGFVEVDRGG